MKTSIIITLEVPGFHHYPEAPVEVSFLRDRHRHIFKIKIAYEVTDLNRQKEFFIEQKRLRTRFDYRYGNPCEFGAMSCEMIASELLKEEEERGAVWVEVWEEDLAGARAEWH